ncbi:MAG: hypothetical protein H7Y20_06740, partial [Bryobacteraceae bacterium]|nr:hypothetical protein [Bryobacteraceae bacterium]
GNGLFEIFPDVFIGKRQVGKVVRERFTERNHLSTNPFGVLTDAEIRWNNGGGHGNDHNSTSTATGVVWQIAFWSFYGR